MKTILVVLFSLCAGMVSAADLNTNVLHEIPVEYCGTFYIHKMLGIQIEDVVPAKLLGKVEAKEVTLENGDVLKVESIKQGTMRSSLTRQPAPTIIVYFEKQSFAWTMAWASDSALTILQTDVPVPLDPRKMHTDFCYVVNREKTQEPQVPLPQLPHRSDQPLPPLQN